jgi:hypothetical protein
MSHSSTESEKPSLTRFCSHSNFASPTTTGRELETEASFLTVAPRQSLGAREKLLGDWLTRDVKPRAA